MNSLPPAMEIGPMRGYVNKKNKNKKKDELVVYGKESFVRSKDLSNYYLHEGGSGIYPSL